MRRGVLEVSKFNIQSTRLLWSLLLMLSFALALGTDNNPVRAQEQNQTQPITARGFPISIIPSLSGNVLGMDNIIVKSNVT